MQKRRIHIDTLIISDTHLGEADVRCREILSILRKYHYRRLILNGDILDGLNFHRFHTEHWQVLSYLRELSKVCEVVWIHGNHDAAAKTLSRLLGVKVSNQYIWKYRGKKYLAMHGHQFDRFMHDNIILSHIAFASYRFLRKFNKTKFLTRLVRNKSNTWKRNSLDVARGAMQYGRLFGVDYVFCGHTHQTNTVRNWGMEYYNSGAWVENPSGYITITDGKPKIEVV